MALLEKKRKKKALKEKERDRNHLIQKTIETEKRRKEKMEFRDRDK